MRWTSSGRASEQEIFLSPNTWGAKSAESLRPLNCMQLSGGKPSENSTPGRLMLLPAGLPEHTRAGVEGMKGAVQGGMLASEGRGGVIVDL